MKVVSAAVVREMDRQAMATGTAGIDLMERAGIGLTRVLKELLHTRYAGTVRRILILAGRGNNGGDGFVMARLLADSIPVDVCITCARVAFSGDARINADRIPDSASLRTVDAIPKELLQPGTLVIDAMLGTGTSGPAREPFAGWIKHLNASECPIVSVDLPSGLNADDGTVSGIAVQADCTITIGAPKTGLYLNDGPRHSGIVRFVDIDLSVPKDAASPFSSLSEAETRQLLQALPADRHKGTMGKILIIGGCERYRGAPILAGRGAIRSGAGLVVASLPAGVNAPSAPHALMIRPIGDATAMRHGPLATNALNDLIADSDVLVIGPGLGRSPDSLAFVRQLLSTDRFTVLDADALEAIEPKTLPLGEKIIITPHPGEFARLAERLGLQQSGDRAADAASLAKKLNATVVLKGLRTVIAAPDGRIAICGRGCAALATGGSGDVLAGLTASLLHRHASDPWTAARLAVQLHAQAAESSPMGDSGFSADDLPEAVAAVIRNLRPNA